MSCNSLAVTGWTRNLIHWQKVEFHLMISFVFWFLKRQWFEFNVRSSVCVYVPINPIQWDSCSWTVSELISKVNQRIGYQCLHHLGFNSMYSPFKDWKLEACDWWFGRWFPADSHGFFVPFLTRVSIETAPASQRTLRQRTWMLAVSRVIGQWVEP